MPQRKDTCSEEKEGSLVIEMAIAAGGTAADTGPRGSGSWFVGLEVSTNRHDDGSWACSIM